MELNIINHKLMARTEARGPKADIRKDAKPGTSRQALALLALSGWVESKQVRSH